MTAPGAVRVLGLDDEVGAAGGGLAKSLVLGLAKGPGPAEEHLAGVEDGRRGREADDATLHGASVHLHFRLPRGHAEGPLVEVPIAGAGGVVEERRDDVACGLGVGTQPSAAVVGTLEAERVAPGHAAPAGGVVGAAQPVHRRGEVRPEVRRGLAPPAQVRQSAPEKVHGAPCLFRYSSDEMVKGKTR